MSFAIHQLVALAYCYRRIIRFCSIGPLFILFVPLICKVLFFIIDYLCSGLGMVSMIFTTVGSISTFQIIYELTKPYENKDIYYKSMAINQKRVPIGLFLVSCYICKTYLHPIFDPWLKNDNNTLWFISLKWMSPPVEVCARIATTMMLLGLVVILRYVGPTSIMRCSSVPLRTNPRRAKLRYFFKYPWILLKPGDTPGELLTFKKVNNIQHTSPIRQIPNELKQYSTISIRNEMYGRRFRGPTIFSILFQITYSMIAGIGVTFLVPDSYVGNDIAVGIVCVMSVLTPLMVSILGKSALSHELHPRLYLYPFSNGSEWRSIIYNKFVVSAIAGISIPIIGISIDYYRPYILSSLLPKTQFWNRSIDSFIVLTVYSFLICAYLYILDDLLKVNIIQCQQVRIKQMVDELQYDESLATTLSIFLESLLMEKNIAAETLQFNDNDRETMNDRYFGRMELEKSVNLMQRISQCFVSAPSAENYIEAAFEEDVFKVILLESIGGTSIARESLLDSAATSRRHQRNVTDWINPGKDYDRDINEIRRIAVTLVRGLSVFIGGFGEAMTLCGSPSSSVAMDNGLPSLSSVYSWSLPPSSFLCVEFAILGLTRCIVTSFHTSGHGRLLDWTNSIVAVAIPSALTALFYVRVGVVNFLKYQTRKIHEASSEERNYVTSYEKELHKLQRLSEAAAIAIMRAMNFNPRVRNIELSEDVMIWTRSLFAQTIGNVNDGNIVATLKN